MALLADPRLGTRALGAVAIFAGGVILSGWPASGLWVLGLFLGIDLVMHGVWWIVFAFVLRRGRPA